MKKRIYYIIYSIIQILSGIYCFLTAESIATEELKSFDFNQLPPSMTKFFSVETYTRSFQFMFIVSIIIGVIFLIMVLKNKKLKKSGLTTFLLIVTFFTSINIVTLLTVITMAMVLSDDATEKKKTAKETIPEINDLKSTKKDYISSIVLIAVYFGQLVFIPLIYKLTHHSMLSQVSYELIIVGVVIWAFKDRYKRDFKYLKNNFKAYAGSAFKYWGIMLLCMVVVGLIQMALGANSQSANQASLETLPILYLIPSALIFAPIVEEAIFRGSLRRFIKNDFVFIIVSGILFGLLHTFLSEDGIYHIIVQSLNYAAMGSVMAYAYTKSNNIYSSMMIHFLQNTLGIIVIIVSMFM